MSDHPINGMMDTTLQRIRDMVDASTVIGEPISAGETTVIPVSKISYGFASGGSDLPTKNTGDYFGGGGGAGVTVTPVAFLVISKDGVRLLQVDDRHDTVNKVVDMFPEIVESIRGLSKKNKE